MSEEYLKNALADPLVRTLSLPEKGFTDDEMKLLSRWVLAGKQGLAKQRAEHMGDLYVLGYSCQEINKFFPEFSLELLLYARARYCWDDLRQKYLVEVQDSTLRRVKSIKAEGVRFLSELMTATHLHWRKKVLAFIANPDREAEPAFIPKNISGYGAVMGLMQDLVDGRAGGKETPTINTLVSVTVKDGQKGREVEVSSDLQEKVKKILIDSNG